MEYLMEDSPFDFKSKLIANAYNGDLSRIFVDGVANIRKNAERLLCDGNEVLAIIDLPVNNRDVFFEYIKLRKLAYKHEGLFMCITIPCMEFSFIRAVEDNLIKDKEAVRIARDYDYFLGSAFSVERDLERKSFEGYCKIVLLHGFRKCVGVRKKKDGCFYFGEDCMVDGCNTLLLKDKAVRVIKELPILPHVFGWDYHPQRTKDIIYALHVALVDMYNDKCDYYNKMGSTVVNEHVMYFPEW